MIWSSCPPRLMLQMWCNVCAQLSMRLLMYIRGRIKRSVWRQSPVDWTASCCRYCLLSIYNWIRSCLFFNNLYLSPFFGHRKEQKSLLIKTCWGLKGPGVDADSPAPQVHVAPQAPVRREKKETATMRPPVPQVHTPMCININIQNKICISSP